MFTVIILTSSAIYELTVLPLPVFNTFICLVDVSSISYEEETKNLYKIVDGRI
jgi:hypothetical protein